MKLILFSSSVPLKPLPCRNAIPCRQMRRGALWPSTLLEVGSGATFSILPSVESSSSSKETSSQVIEGYTPFNNLRGSHVSRYSWNTFSVSTKQFYGLYITLRPLLWGVMHRVSSFLWRDTVGSHISYRLIFIYIYIYLFIYLLTYFVYPFLIIFSNIFTHIDIYIHAYSLAPSRYIHKPHPAFNLKQHAFYIFSSGQLLRSWSTMGGAGQI